MAQITDLYTVDDICTEICDAFDSSTPIDRGKAYRCLTRAFRKISKKGRWPFWRLEDQPLNTVNRQETYFIPGNVKLPEFIHMRNPARKLVMVDLRELRRMYPNNLTMTGTPLYWRTVNFDANAQGWNIALWPIPSGVFNLYLDLDTNPLPIVDKSDDIRSYGLPEEMIETLIALATAFMYEKISAELYGTKMAAAEAMLDQDFYQMTNHPDAELQSREYSGTYDIRREDPRLPPQYNGT